MRTSPRSRAGDKQLKADAFADRLAVHGDRNRAANEIGVSQSYGRILWGVIVRGLGWQAR